MEHKLIVGKYTLESLTNGMYASPLDMYREYIQNAVDSFDIALEKKGISTERLRIDIDIDSEKNKGQRMWYFGKKCSGHVAGYRKFTKMSK